MGVVFRQSVKTTIVIAIGAVLGAFINYSYSFTFTEQELGYNRILLYVGAVFHLVLIVGISATITNFLPRYQQHEQKKTLITLGFLIPFIIALILSIPYFLLKEHILLFFQPGDRMLVRQFFTWIPLFILLWSYMAIFEAFLISQSKVAVMSFFREIMLRIYNIVLLGLFFFKLINFYIYIVLFIGCYAVNLISLFYVSKKSEDFGFSINWKVFNNADYKEIASYSWYHMLVGATLNLLGYVDSFILARYGLSSLAVYGHAVFVVAIMVIPYRAMTVATIPILNKAYLQGDHEYLKDLFHRSGINIFIAAIAMFLLIACNLDNLVAILPHQFAAVKPLVLILMLGRLVDMATGLNNEITTISKFYKYNFRISVVLLIMLVAFNLLLIPKYGIYGAAWGTTIALSLSNIAKMFFLWIKMRLQPFTGKTLLALIAGVVAAIPGLIISPLSNPYVDTVVRSIVIVITYTALLIILKPSADLNSYLISVKQNKRLF